MAGKLRDRQRKKHKKRKPMSEVTPLDMMGAQAKKRYKVHILMEAIKSIIVWATDPDEAARLVMDQGQGTDAGTQGPNVSGVKVEEMGAGTPENAPIIENANTELSPKVKSLIEVVSG
jgi:hypothetical protein